MSELTVANVQLVTAIAIAGMQRNGYSPPHPDAKHHDALLKTFDARWRQHLANAEQFLRRVHELDTEGEDPR